MEKKMRLFLKSPAAAEDKTKVQISLMSQIMLSSKSQTPISIRSRQILIFHLHAFSNHVLFPWRLLTHFQDKPLKRLWRSRLCGVEVWVLFELCCGSERWEMCICMIYSIVIIWRVKRLFRRWVMNMLFYIINSLHQCD